MRAITAVRPVTVYIVWGHWVVEETGSLRICD